MLAAVALTAAVVDSSDVDVNFVVVAVAAVVAVVVRLIQCLNPKATRRYHRRHPRGFLGSLCPSHRQRGGVPTYRTRGWSVCHFGLVYQAVPPTRKRRMHEEITRHALTHHTYAPLSPSYRTCTHTHANAVRARTHSLACSYEKVSTDIHIRTRTLTFVWSPVCDRRVSRHAPHALPCSHCHTTFLLSSRHTTRSLLVLLVAQAASYTLFPRCIEEVLVNTYVILGMRSTRRYAQPFVSSVSRYGG